jgi:hypothetical protein
MRVHIFGTHFVNRFPNIRFSEEQFEAIWLCSRCHYRVSRFYLIDCRVIDNPQRLVPEEYRDCDVEIARRIMTS